MYLMYPFVYNKTSYSNQNQCLCILETSKKTGPLCICVNTAAIDILYKIHFLWDKCRKCLCGRKFTCQSSPCITLAFEISLNLFI